MGYYVQTEGYTRDKAQRIAEAHDGVVLTVPPPGFSDVPAGKALICVVANGLFEAAAFCYSEREFIELTQDEHDWRRHTYVLIDWHKACELTGYHP